MYTNSHPRQLMHPQVTFIVTRSRELCLADIAIILLLVFAPQMLIPRYRRREDFVADVTGVLLVPLSVLQRNSP